MKFNMKKHIGKQSMAVPLPSDEIKRQLTEENFGLANDEEEYFKQLRSKLEDMTPETMQEMGLNGGEILKTIPLTTPLAYEGRNVYPITIDKDAQELVAFDPSIEPGEMVPNGKKRQPNNYIRIPLTHPAVAEMMNLKEQQEAPARAELLNVVKSYNKFLKDLSDPEKLKGVNLVQIPLMIFKERSGMIQPRLKELQEMEGAVERKIQSYSIPSSLVAMENELFEKVNNHSLNFKDENDTIMKLYKGRLEDLRRDIDSGALSPSETWRNAWLSEIPINRPDGQSVTVSRLQYIINKQLEQKQKEREKEGTMKDEVVPPGEFLEEIPSKVNVGTPTFSGPASSMVASNHATLNGIKEEIGALNKLDERMKQAADTIISLQSKSDEYLLQHPEEYTEILNGIRVEASEFVRRHAASIQNKPGTWATKPRGFDKMPPEEQAKYKPQQGGGLMLPGTVNASFLGKTIASAGVALYLYRIIGIINTIDGRLAVKREAIPTEPVQASSSGINKMAQENPNPETPEQPQIGQEQNIGSKLDYKTDEARKSIKKFLNDFIDSDETKMKKIYTFIAPRIGLTPESLAMTAEPLKSEYIEKAIDEMSFTDLSKFNKLLYSI